MKPEESAKKYFSQLTKQQVSKLYEMYKIDHEMFEYDPQIYIDMAFPYKISIAKFYQNPNQNLSWDGFIFNFFNLPT